MSLPEGVQPYVDRLAIVALTHRRAPAHCVVDGCGRSTREGKPWCAHHVLTHSPYARQVALWVEAREAELAWAASGSTRATPIIEADVLHTLAVDGSNSVERVGQIVHVKGRALAVVVERLRRKGRIRVSEVSQRGTVTIALVRRVPA